MKKAKWKSGITRKVEIRIFLTYTKYVICTMMKKYKLFIHNKYKAATPFLFIPLIEK